MSEKKKKEIIDMTEEEVSSYLLDKDFGDFDFLFKKEPTGEDWSNAKKLIGYMDMKYDELRENTAAISGLLSSRSIYLNSIIEECYKADKIREEVDNNLVSCGKYMTAIHKRDESKK